MTKRELSRREKLMRKAIRLAGGQAALGRGMGKSQQYVWTLLKNPHRVSAEDAVGIERATDGKVTRLDLRPDLFGETA